MKRSAIALIISVFYLSACQHGTAAAQEGRRCVAPRGQARERGNELEVTGSITAPLFECMKAMHLSRFSKVDVDLSGGEPEPSLAIAQIFALSRPVIHIERFCGSSCAYLLLPTASRIEAEPGSMVLFHTTNTSSSLLLSRGTSPDRQRYENLSKAESDLYDKLHIGKWLLTGPFNHQGPICFSSEPSPGIYRAKWKSLFIDRELLKRLGLSLPETVAGDPAEMERALERLPDRGAGVIQGGLGYISGDDIGKNEIADPPETPDLPICFP